MNIPPILERLLLSNEAVFKNASLGLSGQNMVFVPAGKTAVILEVSIEPFINNISNAVLSILTDGYKVGNAEVIYRQLIKRIHYQLQIINDKYQTYISLNDSIQFNTNYQTDTSLNGFITIKFNGKREELFIYTDRSLYFNLIYPYKVQEIGQDTTGIKINYDTPDQGFLPKIQNIPPSPTTFYKNIFENYVINTEINSPAADHYYPVNHQSSATYPELSQMEYLRFFNGVNESTIQQPKASGTELDFHDLLTIPFINVKYALINKRASDYGIVAPKNL